MKASDKGKTTLTVATVKNSPRYMMVLVNKKTLDRVQSYPVVAHTDYSVVEGCVDAMNKLHLDSETEYAIDDYEPSTNPHLVRFNRAV